MLNNFNKVDTNKRAIYVNQCIKLYDTNIQLDGWRDKSPQGLEKIAYNPLKKKTLTCFYWTEVREDRKKTEKCSAFLKNSSSSDVRFNKITQRVVKHIGLNASFQR